MSDFAPRLERFLGGVTAADKIEIQAMQLLSGGAVQQNWLVDVLVEGGVFTGSHSLVMRTDAPTGLSHSHSRAEEYALLKVAFAAGVKVPEPLFLCEDTAVIGRPFFLMRRVAGTAAGHLIVRDGSVLGGNRVALTHELGRQLARIHSIGPQQGRLEFLETFDGAPALHMVRRYREFLDDYPLPYPALEWALRWLELNAPPRGRITLTHRDFRTGNYMVDEQGLTGVLDWEFAAWGDPLEDIGWFCAKCWRFGHPLNEAGGVGQREDFYRGYEEESGQCIPREIVHYWEVMAHLYWAITTIQQAERHLSGHEESLLLALTGHITPELEWEIFSMTEMN